MKDVEDFYPLSPTQHGILFHALYAPNTRVYFQQLNSTLKGELDPHNFRRAWQQVVDRHPSLRCSFLWEDLKEPIQVVHRGAQLPFEHLDWRYLDAADQGPRLESFLEQDRERGFDLTVAPLMRLTLIQMADDEFQFTWSFHHIILDGWSGAIVQGEVMALYEAFERGEQAQFQTPRPYRDYISWLRQQDLAEAEAFWRKQLAGFTAATPLRLARQAASLPDEEEGYDERLVEISQSTTEALQSLARENRITLNTLVTGAWALLLSRHSGEDDVLFGVVVSGRPPELDGVESMVGLFINTLPMRIEVPAQMPVLSWLKKLQEQQLEMQKYEYSPLVQIQLWSEVPRVQPMFESIFAFENYPVGSSLNERRQGLKLTGLRTYERTSYPITVLAGVAAELTLRILYDCRIVDAAAVAQILKNYCDLLDEILANPHQEISGISFLTEEESDRLINSFNADLEV